MTEARDSSVSSGSFDGRYGCVPSDPPESAVYLNFLNEVSDWTVWSPIVVEC